MNIQHSIHSSHDSIIATTTKEMEWLVTSCTSTNTNNGTTSSCNSPSSPPFAMNSRSMKGNTIRKEDEHKQDDNEELDLEHGLSRRPSTTQPVTSNVAELNSLFDDFMHFGSVGLHIVDDQGVIVWANQAELDLLGYTKEEYFGQPIDIIHTNMNCLDYLLTTLLSGEKVQNFIAPLKTKDGRIEYVQINSSMRQVQGKCVTTRCFSAVVTDKVLREQAMLEAHAQKREAAILKEQTERKTNFLRKLCHELRNPLQGIKGNLDLLIDELRDMKQDIAKLTVDNDDIAANDNKNAVASILHQFDTRLNNALEFAESCHLATEHQMMVINETLSLERLESEQGGLEAFHPRPVDTAAMVRQVHAIMGVKAFEKGLNVEYNIVSDQAKYIYTDPVWLKQIFINLISNSIKFTFRGKIVVTIDTCPFDKANNDRDSNDSNTNMALKVTVKDDGIGMTPSEQEKLFGVFAQANENIATTFGGSGLGLNIIKQMLEYLGGTISVLESIKDVGTTFEFIMPCQIRDNNDIVVPNESKVLDVKDNVATASCSVNNEATACATLKTMNSSYMETNGSDEALWTQHKDSFRIVIVDDSPTNLKILSNFLRRNGYTKHEVAVHGRQVYEMHQQNPYDLIMTDIDMPVMDGLELTKQIRIDEEEALLRKQSDGNPANDRISHHVPIIGISGNVLPEDAAFAIQIGMNEYVGKPYSFPSLEALMKKYLCQKYPE